MQELQTLGNVGIIEVSQEIAAQSARYRMGMNMATVDSIILTTILLQKCDVLLTTDSVFLQESVRSLISVELLG